MPYGALLTYALEHEIYWLDLMLAAAFLAVVVRLALVLRNDVV